MGLRRSFFIGLALGSLIIILFNIALLLGVSVDPVINEVVNFAWSAQVVTPSVVGRPTASFAWGSSIVFPDVVDHPSASLVWGFSIIPPCVIDEPNARLSSRVWVLNSSGLFTGSGALVTYPWVNCTYLVREGFVIVPAVAGANVSGYVDVNVSNPTLLQYLIKEPVSALITLDGSTTPLKYYVYDVNTTYIIYRVVLENVSDGPHILWVYVGGNGKYGVLGVPNAGNVVTLLNITAFGVENRPSSCVVTVTTTTVKPNAAYIPPQSSTTPYVTWVSPPLYVTAGSGNGVHDVVEHIRNAVVYLLRNPLVLILMLMMLGGFLLIVGGSHRRY